MVCLIVSDSSEGICYMPLTPEIEALLKAGAEAGIRPAEELSVADAREQIRAVCLSRDPGPKVDDVENRTIPGPSGEIPVRIYYPDGQAPFPVLVYFHGSGFVIADLDTHDNICRELTNLSGCAVVSVDYRLAPENPYPAAPEDAYAATQWVSENGNELNVDGTRLITVGDSAGGNLATVVALMALDRGGPNIIGQILIYPITDYNFDRPSYRENASGYGLGLATMHWYWGHYLTSESDGADIYVSPIRTPDLSGLPPAHVVTAEYDPLRDEGEAYAEALRAANVSTTSMRYDGVIHGFAGMLGQVPEAREAITGCAKAIKSMLA